MNKNSDYIDENKALLRFIRYNDRKREHIEN